jgi:hypothetical protein
MTNCNGCLTNQPNQLAHMDEGGCLNIKGSNLLLYKLEEFMLTPSNVHKYSYDTTTLISENPREKDEKNTTKEKKCKKEKKENLKVTEKKELENFSPSEKDKLFWCFYILLYGFEEYQISKSSSFAIEKNFKIKTVEQVSKIKDKLKEMKIKLTDVQDELVNQPIISTKGLQVLCLMYDISIMLVKDRTLYEIIVNDKPLKVIVINSNKIYIQDEIDEEKLTEYRNNYWKIDNPSKPLKAFSSYSLNELQDICKKLEISIMNDGKKIQKKELYEQIISKL